MSKVLPRFTAVWICLAVFAGSFSLHCTAASGAVTGLSAKAKSESSIVLTWNQTDNASGYKIYRYDYGAKKWNSICKTQKTTYTDKKLSAATKYTYRIRSFETTNGKTVLSPASKSVSEVTKLKKTAALKVASNSESKFTISWKKVEKAKQYEIFQFVTSEWIKVKTTSKTSYSESGLKPGSKLSFKVRARTKVQNKTVYSSFSDVLALSTLPKKVSKLKAATSCQNGIALCWQKAQGADGYEVFRLGENGKWVFVKNADNEFSFVDANLPSSGKYSYKVRAYAKNGTKKFRSAFCSAVSHTYKQTTEPKNPYESFGDVANTGVAGYLYDKKGGYFYTASDPWQRNFGYNLAYDAAAPMVLIDYDTVRLKFKAENKDWMIQLWKGQYGMVFYGAEIGVYTKPESRKYKHYDCAQKNDHLKMSFEFYEREWSGNKRVWVKKFERPYGTYWWCTGFIPGNNGLSYSDLMMKNRITLKSFEMLSGFTKALEKKKIEYEVNGLDIFFTYR